MNSLWRGCGFLPTSLLVVVVCIRSQYSFLTRLDSAKLFRRVLGRGIRFGEAKNPGPDDLRFAICNPTSLTNKVEAFQALREIFHCHFIAASETSATQPVQVLVQRKMRQMGYFSAFTSAVPSLRARADHQISLRGKAMGCACFSLAPVRHSRCTTTSKLGMDLRMLHVIVDEWKLQLVAWHNLTLVLRSSTRNFWQGQPKGYSKLTCQQLLWVISMLMFLACPQLNYCPPPGFFAFATTLSGPLWHCYASDMQRGHEP